MKKQEPYFHDACLALHDSRKFCKDCFQKAYFYPHYYKVAKYVRQCCLICGFRIRSVRSTVVVCNTCYETVNARYLSWKRRTGWIPKSGVRFKDVMRSALWHDAPLIWNEDVRGLMFFSQGAKHRGEVKRTMDFHQTRWRPKVRTPAGSCVICGGRPKEGQDTCLWCSRTALQLQGRICECV